MKKLVSALLTALCLSFSALAFAAHPLTTDDTGTQGMMKFQVETAAEFGTRKANMALLQKQIIKH